MSSEQSLIPADLIDLEEAAAMMQQASYRTLDHPLREFLDAVAPGTKAGDLLQTLLPRVDFDEWFASVKSTVRSMVGSGKLIFPDDRATRVALNLELLRRIRAGDIQLLRSILIDFLYVANNFNLNFQQYLQHVFRPFYRDLQRLLMPYVQDSAVASENPTTLAGPPFVDLGRIDALQRISSKDFDLSKLVRFCEELNTCYGNGCFLAVAALTRALMDHVPPIFGVTSFGQVANNYPGAKSFKESMKHLDGSARKIGDTHLHVQIRSRESLPNATQVNFANDLDVLLAEVIRLLR